MSYADRPDGSVTRAGLPVIGFASAKEFEARLEASHAAAPGLWLAIARAASGRETVSYSEAVDVALCFGWIDGQKSKLDDDHWLQRFTPRKPASRWSKVNRTRAEALIAAARMRPAGQAAIDQAKADGRWEAAYDSPSTATVPPDLESALAADPEAAAFFTTLNSANRYSILHRIAAAKKPETRATRITRFVTMLHNHETLHP